MFVYESVLCVASSCGMLVLASMVWWIGYLVDVFGTVCVVCQFTTSSA